jgi:hypothetical protein
MKQNAMEKTIINLREYKIMDTQKEEARKTFLDKTGLKLKKLLFTDMNTTRIKDSKDIDCFIRITKRSLYPSNEESVLNIYKYSNDDDNTNNKINDLKENYNLTEKYLLAFKSVMNNELNKLLQEVNTKQETLKEMEEMKFQKKIKKILQQDKDTKTEAECLKRISMLPNDIIMLIESYALTPELRLTLIKQKYDTDMFNILNKMNVKSLNTFINQSNNIRTRKYTYLCIQQPMDYFDTLLTEFNIKNNRVCVLGKKSSKIKSIVDDLSNYYNLLELLKNTNKYSNVCRNITQNLIQTYNTYIYISNRTIELNIIKNNKRKIQRKEILKQIKEMVLQQLQN